MATYKVVDAEQLDAGLTAVANAIRAKGGTTESLDFPDEMEAAVEAIKTTPTLQNKTVTPTTSRQSVTADSGYDGLDTVTVEAMPTATQATPSISVNSSGLITASAEQSAGYVAAGTKSATQQLSTKGAATITPGTSNQTIDSGLYLTGAQTIKGDANLKAANIASGVSIFGVAGSLTPGSQVATGTVTIARKSGLYPSTTNTITLPTNFTPKNLVITLIEIPGGAVSTGNSGWVGKLQNGSWTFFDARYPESYQTTYQPSVSVSDGKVTLTKSGTNNYFPPGDYHWIATT